MDLRKEPRQRVDVTLLDTYGELDSLDERVRTLAADPSNGAIVVFSFSDRPVQEKLGLWREERG